MWGIALVSWDAIAFAPPPKNQVTFWGPPDGRHPYLGGRGAAECSIDGGTDIGRRQPHVIWPGVCSSLYHNAGALWGGSLCCISGLGGSATLGRAGLGWCGGRGGGLTFDFLPYFSGGLSKVGEHVLQAGKANLETFQFLGR